MFNQVEDRLDELNLLSLTTGNMDGKYLDLLSFTCILHRNIVFGINRFTPLEPLLNGQIIVTVCKRSCGKVMFSQLSVSHSVHRGYVHGGGRVWQGGMHGRGCAWQERWPLLRTVRILLEYFLV